MTRVVILSLLVLLTGCAQHAREPSSPRPAGFVGPCYAETVKATVVPPLGWTRLPVQKSADHTHETWLSPSGDTAYGIIHFSLPLPLGADIALCGFLREMRNRE